MVVPGSLASPQAMAQPTPKFPPHLSVLVALTSPPLVLVPTAQLHVPVASTVTAPVEASTVMVPVGAGGLAGAGRAKAGVAPKAAITTDDKTTVMARPAMRRG